MCVCVYVCVCARALVCVCMCVCARALVCVCMCVCVCALVCVCVYVYVYVCACVHAFVYIPLWVLCRDKRYSVYNDQEEAWLFESLKQLKQAAISPENSPHHINGFTPLTETPKMEEPTSVSPVNGTVELPQVMMAWYCSRNTYHACLYLHTDLHVSLTCCQNIKVYTNCG